MLNRGLAALLVAMLAAACTDPPDAIGDPIAVESGVDIPRSGQPVLRVGAVVDRTSPSAERDRALLDRVREAASLVPTDHDLQLEVATIDEPDDIPGALDLLTELGVTVLLTTCDTTSVPAIAAAAADRALFTVTGCASLPHPDVPRSPLFADLANVDHVHEAMSTWARQESHAAALVISSDLLRDVDQVCSDFESSFVRRGGRVIASTRFTEVLDPIADAVAELALAVEEADVVAACALPGSIGPVIEELRAAGVELPVVVPWFAADEDWSGIDHVHLLAPASRHGDDPVELVNAFVDGGSSDDAILLDTVVALTLAADAAGSVGSQRLNDALLEDAFEVPTGPLEVDPATRKTTGRTYRLIEIDGGEGSFDRLIVVG